MGNATASGGRARSAGKTALLTVLAVGLLGVVWVLFTVVTGTVLGHRSGAYVALGAVVTMAGASVVLGRAVRTTAEIAAYLAGIVLVLAVFLGLVWLVLFALTTIAFESTFAALIARGVTLVFGAACVLFLGLLLTDSDAGTNWALSFRMTTAIVSLAFCLVAFFALLWPLASLVPLFFTSVLELPVAVGLYCGAALVLYEMWHIVVAEHEQVTAVADRLDAAPVSPEAEPELHARVTRVAKQLDVPKPTVAVSETAVPEAMVVGFRPSNMHLVLSRGVIEALGDDELDTVVAHELAHVANRDAMVMTAVSTPLVIADSLLPEVQTKTTVDAAAGAGEENDATGDDEAATDDIWDGEDDSLTREQLYGEDGEWRMTATSSGRTGTDHERDGDDGDDSTDEEPFYLVALVDAIAWLIGLWFKTLAIVAKVVWVVSHVIVSVFSRARETVADRAAAEVTGSPAALASALGTLDDRIAATPNEDLRRIAGVSSLSILPFEPDGEDTSPATFGDRIRRRLFRTHPPTERRIEVLEDLERREKERRSE